MSVRNIIFLRTVRIEVDALNQETHMPKSSSSDQGINISKEQLSQFAVSMGQNIKVEHVVTGLNMVKQYLPTLMIFTPDSGE